MIEAIRLLAWVAEGNRLGNIRHMVADEDRTVRGTVRSLPRQGRSGFRLGAETIVEQYSSYELQLYVRDDGDLHITNESIKSSRTTVPLFTVTASAAEGGSDIRVAYDNFARGGRKPQLTATDQTSVMTQLMSSARFEGGHKKSQRDIPRVCSAFQRALTSILFLDPQPAMMRDYSFKTDTRLNAAGSNLSGVLYTLCQTHDGKADILKFIQSLPEQEISAIDFIETPRGEVMVQLKETFGGRKQTYDATLLSDGTLRVLSIAAAILSAPEQSLVVIEEIDNGVHPSRAEQLLNSILDIAVRRKLQVLLSSHNPALLDALPHRAVPNVVFCYRDPADGASRMVRLQDIERYPELIAQGTVGHLLTRGVIDRFVKTAPTKDEKKRKSLDWLRSLENSTG